MHSLNKSRHVLPAATALLAIVNFSLDTLTDVESATAVLYVAVVLMSLGFAQRRGVILVGVGCMGLTLVSFLFARTGSPHSALINGVISLSAIAITTYLALQIKSAQIAEREAREQLAHVARLGVLGELTASIAHEVNQPLAAISSSSDACRHWLEAEPINLTKARQAVERIANDVRRASEVITRVRAFATRIPPQKVRVNVNDCIMNVASLVRSEIEQYGISLRLQLASDMPFLIGDEVQLQQVLLNLIVNAIEAMRSMRAGHRELLLRSEREISSVLISVHDTGPDLGLDSLDRVFEAFYTTKPSGLGMGLSISRSIIEAHGGQIWLKRNVSRGAVALFRLPITHAEDLR